MAGSGAVVDAPCGSANSVRLPRVDRLNALADQTSARVSSLFTGTKRIIGRMSAPQTTRGAGRPRFIPRGGVASRRGHLLAASCALLRRIQVLRAGDLESGIGSRHHDGDVARTIKVDELAIDPTC
jgi:hypothetical protein